LQQAGQGFAIGADRRRQDDRYQQAQDFQARQHADAQAERQQALLARLAQSRAEVDPENALAHLDQAGGYAQGKLRPRLQVPGGESALAAFSKGAFPDEELRLSPAAAPITPGRTPAAIALERMLAKAKLDHENRLALENVQQSGLDRRAEADRAEQERRNLISSGTTLLGHGYEPALIPGAQAQLGGAPQPQGIPPDVQAKLQQLFGGLTRIGGGGGIPAAMTAAAPQLGPPIPRPPSALERLGPNPRVQADLEQSRAAIAASQAAEAASRANTGYTQERTETERLMRGPKMDALRAEIDAKRLTGAQVKARIDYMRKQGQSIDRRDELAALDYTRRVRADEGRENYQAGQLGLGRDRINEDARQFDAEAPYRAARTAYTQQQLAKLNPKTAATVRGLDQRIGRLEGQINRLRTNGEDDAADALEDNLLDLVRMKDEALNAPGAVQGGASSARPTARPRVSGGTQARSRFIAEMRRQGYSPAEAARKADNVGLK
jgi:hypothetical protein